VVLYSCGSYFYEALFNLREEGQKVYSFISVWEVVEWEGGNEDEKSC